ncbi:MAG: hypothetical protein QHG99_07450 [Methanomicrobiales archaeon]|nr:hypothetical protein [Methanomicrobiales archaeon]
MEALSLEGLELDAVAYYIQFDKINIEKTGVAKVRMTVPSAWVEEHGGANAIRVVRIADDGTISVPQLTFLGTDESGNMIFEALSPDGLSIFAMASAKVKAAAAQEIGSEPAATPASPLTPLSVVGSMVVWLVENPILTIGLVLILVLALVMGRQRVSRRGAGGPTSDYGEGGVRGDPHESARQLALNRIMELLNEIDEQLNILNAMLARPRVVLTHLEAEAIVEKFFTTCQVVEVEIKKAASEGHLTKKQIEHLNAQLSNAVQQMNLLSQKSQVLHELVQAKVEAGNSK